MPVTVAPSPLAPGFPRTWPECQPAMRERVRAMLKRGASDQTIGRTLLEEFPGLLLLDGAEWRRGARYALVIADEQMKAHKAGRDYPKRSQRSVVLEDDVDTI